MSKSFAVLLCFTFSLLLTNCQQVPTQVFVFNATYGAASNFIIQAPFDFKWSQVLIDPTTSYMRQSFMNKQEANNMTQFQLGVSGPVQPLAISSVNHTCALMYHILDNSFILYHIDPTSKTISIFKNLSNIVQLQSVDPNNVHIVLTQHCNAIKINEKFYHYNPANLQYVQNVLPFPPNQNLGYDNQLTILSNEQQLYQYNNNTSQYQFLKNISVLPDRQIYRSDSYPDRVIIASTNFTQNSNSSKISINQFKNGELVSLKEINAGNLVFFQSDRALSRIIFTIALPSQVKINALYINYDINSVSNMQVAPIFYTFTSKPFVLMTQNYLYVREMDQCATSNQCRQYIHQFLGSNMIQISARTYTQNQNYGFQMATIQERDTQFSVYAQIQTSPFVYSVSQLIFNKTNSQPTIPNAPDPNLFSFTYPNGVDVRRSQVHPKWMYLQFNPGNTTTTMTGQIFALGQTDNKITISDNRAGNWQILGGTDITLNCAIAFDPISSHAKLFYYNQATRTGQQKADVTGILVAEGVSDPSTVGFDVSDQCEFFKIGSSIYYFDGSQFSNVTVMDNNNNPTNFVNAVFDQTFKIAVINGSIYQHSPFNNRYYVAYTPDASKPILDDRQVFLNQDKLLILSSITNANNPPVSQYRVHCLWTNGTNWMEINVQLQGQALYQPPGMGMSPDYQTFGIGGINLTGSPFIKGRVVKYQEILSFQNNSVKNVLIPSEMLYNNQIPYAKLSNNYFYYRRLPNSVNPVLQNHQAFYQIDKANGILKFINSRNLTSSQQAIWKNSFIQEINSSMVIFYETQQTNSYTIKLTQRVVGNANGGGSPTANMDQSDTGILMTGGQTYMCPTGCSSCISANTCQQCSDGFALDPTTSNCKRCKGSCQTCLTSNANACTSCFAGTYLSGDSCLLCHSTCIECDTISTNCTKCKPGMILAGGACSDCPLSNCINCQDSSTCLECKSGFVLNSSNQCVQCTSTCNVCDSSNILTCLDCKDGFQLNITSSKCIKCPDHCKVCLNGICSQCRKNFRLTSNGKCAKKCEFPCMTCSDSNPSSCLSCSGQYILSSNKCSPNSNCNTTSTCSKCALGYVLFSGVCYPCQAGNTCKQCDSQDLTVCVSCRKGYYLNQNSICQQCPAQCSSCQTAQTCTSCTDGYTLSGDSSASQCLICQQPCKTCSQSTTNCLSCINGYKLQGWKCRSNINIQWTFELNLNFASISTNDILAILAQLASILNIPLDHITLMQAHSGSTVLSGSSDASSPAAVSAGLSALSSAGSGGSLGGFPIISASFTGNSGDSQQNKTATLIIALAVAIPIVVITSIIVVVILLKKGIIGKTVAVSQSQIQLQSQDYINPMNLKQLKISQGPMNPSYTANTFY